MPKTKILILGGGFGGVKAALELCRADSFDITLISDHDDFRFYPALYTVATGRRTSASSIPLREILDGKPIKFIKAKAIKLDRESRQVQTDTRQTLGYDKLIIALGVTTNFFGIKGLEQYSFGIKTLNEAERLRDFVHEQVLAGKEHHYVVIGGGPTGVELAGALPGYIKRVEKLHNLPPSHYHIDLVEAAPRLLPRMSKGYSRAVSKRLKKLGIHLYMGQRVEAETADGLKVSGHEIASHCVIWTAGVTNHGFFRENNFGLDEHGKAVVDEFLAAEEDIYIIGDNAATPYSGMAQTALHDAIFVAANLKRLARGRRARAYKTVRPVYITPAGEGWAAVNWRGLNFYGRLGWWLREAADWVAFHDYEPFWQASKHLLAERSSEHNCPTCAQK